MDFSLVQTNETTLVWRVKKIFMRKAKKEKQGLRLKMQNGFYISGNVNHVIFLFYVNGFKKVLLFYNIKKLYLKDLCKNEYTKMLQIKM